MRSCPLDGMNRSENTRKRVSILRVFLQAHQFPVQPVQVFAALQQEFANDLVVHPFFLHLFRFGTWLRLLRPSPALLPIFLFCAHTIPFANAPALTFPVHLSFQPYFLRRQCRSTFPDSLLDTFLSASLLFSSIHAALHARISASHTSRSSTPRIPPFQLGASRHSGTPPFMYPH